MRAFSLLVLSSVMAVALGGCQTIQRASEAGGGSFVLQNNDNIDNAIEEAQVNKCPRVTIVDELGAINDFMDISDPSEYNLVSEATLDLEESSCVYRKSNVSVDLKLAFYSRLGQRGKLNDKDKPFVSYPFFVAVTNPDGNILAKEVFGASMTYDRGEEKHTYFENLRQIIPIINPDKGKDYEILVGFQLTPEQLAYNRDMQLGRADDEINGKQYRPMNVTPKPKPAR